MTPEEAKEKMDLMVKNVSTFWLPEGFKVSINVPKEIADLTRVYYENQGPFGNSRPFAAGEVFYYKGIRCFATPEKIEIKYDSSKF